MGRVAFLIVFPFLAVALCGCNESGDTYFSVSMGDAIWNIECSASAAKELKSGFVLDAPASRSSTNGFVCANATISLGVSQTENARKDIASSIYQAENQPIVRLEKESDGYSRELRLDKAVARFSADLSTAKLYGKNGAVLVETPLEGAGGSLLWDDVSSVVSSLQFGKGSYIKEGFAWKIGFYDASTLVLDAYESHQEKGYDVESESLWIFRGEQNKWRIGRTHETVTFRNNIRTLSQYRQTEYGYLALPSIPVDEAKLGEEDFYGYTLDQSRLSLVPLAHVGAALTEGLTNLGIPRPFERPLVFSPSFADSFYDTKGIKTALDERTMALTEENEPVSVWDFISHF